MAKLIIIGAGGFGREVLEWALDQQAESSVWKVIGFLDSNPHALNHFDCDLPILGSPESFAPSPSHLFVCAIGNPAVRLRIAEMLSALGAAFTNVIHPSAYVSRRCRIGVGCIICPGAIISANATLGNHVVLNMHGTVAHDSVLAHGATLACHADVTGAAVLERGAMLGSHASVMPRVRVGTFGMVGAGSVAYKDVPPHTTVVGVPARPVPSDKHSRL